jgi:hypothetical protein
MVVLCNQLIIFWGVRRSRQGNIHLLPKAFVAHIYFPSGHISMARLFSKIGRLAFLARPFFSVTANFNLRQVVYFFNGVSSGLRSYHSPTRALCISLFQSQILQN